MTGKEIILLAAAALCLAGCSASSEAVAPAAGADATPASVQTPATQLSAREQIAANPYKAGGVYYLYEFEGIPASSPVPEGYKPVYISHYGRHGARYLDSKTYIDGTVDILRKGHECGQLTRFGESVYKRVLQHLDKAKNRLGDLSEIGWEQHQKIARNMAAAYPEVVCPGTRVEAISTVYPRCILSMSSFCQSLTACCPSLRLTADTGLCYQDELNAHRPENPSFRGVYPDVTKFTRIDDWGQYNMASFAARVVDYKGIIGRIFKDYEFVREWDEPSMFCFNLFSFVLNMQDAPSGVDLMDVFTTDDLYNLWRVDNFYLYNSYGPTRHQDVALLRHIVEHADEDLAGELPFVRLRFGHDTCVGAILCMLNADGWATVPEDAFHIEDTFQSWRITMAATIVMAFYRNDRGDTLVKFTLNERELSLPQLQSVSGPFYKWSDVRRYCLDYIGKYKLCK